MAQSGRLLSILAKIGKPKWRMAAILWKYSEKACARHNMIRNAPINFIVYVAIELQVGKVAVDFGENRLTK